jgi:hypothetical protein
MTIHLGDFRRKDESFDFEYRLTYLFFETTTVMMMILPYSYYL